MAVLCRTTVLVYCARVSSVLSSSRCCVPVEVTRPSPLGPYYYSTSPPQLSPLQNVKDKYERFLQHRFPHFYIYYNTFTKGLRQLLEDFRETRRIKRRMSVQNLQFRDLPYREMEKVLMFHKDMAKAVLLLLISLPPFAICLVFTLMYLFPRQLLFHHFWTTQQQTEFKKLYHQHRTQKHQEIIRGIARTVPHIQEWTARCRLLALCNRVQNGVHPSVSDLHALLDHFSGPPLAISAMEARHMRSLCSQIFLTPWLPAVLLRLRLRWKAEELLYLDRALQNLGLFQLSNAEIQQACYFRGINPSSLSSSQCKDWLHQWLQLSSKVKESETSLLLHCMALLSVNYPNP
ncbi:LETM1 domain-containing protein 1-like [Denticeps clupeoides]|uniref:Letm1 RBD domain-containing protein n=1 Tax=Denticeps clupeoides TaxID=299321 RepID=A0AAY3ZZ17_9TELE|nr:LETM1 domain-containing protein 1-like [Denticeps clupeoides]